MKPIKDDPILTQLCDEYVKAMKDFIELVGGYDLSNGYHSQAFRESIEGLDSMTRVILARIAFYETYGLYR